MTVSADKGRMEKMEKFLDELGPIVDGDRAAIERHADFLADDDGARDLRHDAGVVAERLAVAGDDWVMPADLEAKVLAAVDAKAASFGGERTTQPGFAPGKIDGSAVNESETKSDTAREREPSTPKTLAISSAAPISLASVRAEREAERPLVQQPLVEQPLART